MGPKRTLVPVFRGTLRRVDPKTVTAEGRPGESYPITVATFKAEGVALPFLFFFA